MLRFMFAVLVISVCTLCNAIKGQQIDRMGPAPLNRHEEKNIRDSKAEEILKYMNLTADPCTDFYDFACGNWPIDHAEVPEGELATVQSEVELRVREDMKHFLEKQMPGSSEVGNKVFDFYNSCLNVPTSTDNQRSFILNFVKQYGGVPSIAGSNWNINNNWVHVLAKLRANYGMNILIGLEIDTNLQTMSGNSIYLTEPKTTLIPAEHCSASATHQKNFNDQVYEDLKTEISLNLQDWYSLKTEVARQLAHDIVSFEFELCKNMRKDPSNMVENEPNEILQPPRANAFRTGQNRLHGLRANTQYLRHSLQDFTLRFGNVINFKEYVDISLDTSVNDQVYMRSEVYFQHLARTIKLYKRSTLTDYIMYRALSAFSLSNDRGNSCYDLVVRYFPHIVGEMYKNRYFRREVSLDAEQLYKEVNSAFNEALSADWIDENIRRAARQKLAFFKLIFPIYQNLDLSKLHIENMGFWQKLERVIRYNAKNFRSYDVNSDNPLGSLQANDVEIKLSPTENVILISWGILQQPFYHFFYPNSLKFSILAQRMARELVMAFDEEGWHRHPLKTLRWDAYTMEGYHNHSECMRTQYSNYLYNNPDIFHNETKLRELIADSAGLNIAFNAYLAWLNSIDIRDQQLRKETLPEVNFTNTQLFFINFAQTRCVAKHNNTSPPEFLPLQKHTDERYHVNGPLGNNVEFAREFGCRIGTEMNPDDKCMIF